MEPTGTKHTEETSAWLCEYANAEQEFDQTVVYADDISGAIIEMWKKYGPDTWINSISNYDQ